MTPDSTASPSARGQHRRHRLVPRAELAAGYESRYGSTAVSEYGLAVRDVVETCPEIGPVDTWSRLAGLICRRRPDRDRDGWRKRLSRHFTTETKGPPWQTTVLVVEYAVPAADRNATLERFARLYEAARGEKPPSRRDRTDDGTSDADGRDATSGIGRRGEVTAAEQADAGGIAELRRQNAVLRRQLAATRAENDLLRAALRAPARQAGQQTSRHRRPGGGTSGLAEVPRQRTAGVRAGPPRSGPNPGHFPTGPVGTNDAADRHRSSRLDQVWLTPRRPAARPAYLLDPPQHAPGGGSRRG